MVNGKDCVQDKKTSNLHVNILNFYDRNIVCERSDLSFACNI